MLIFAETIFVLRKRLSYRELLNKVELLSKRVAELEGLAEENEILRERLAKYENPKNSRNSSIPPSQDENRPKKNQSLRKSSGKKPGGRKDEKEKH